MRFYVIGKATFPILLGRDTIRKHGILTRSKPDTEGEEALIGVHDDLNEGMSIIKEFPGSSSDEDSSYSAKSGYGKEEEGTEEVCRTKKEGSR